MGFFVLSSQYSAGVAQWRCALPVHSRPGPPSDCICCDCAGRRCDVRRVRGDLVERRPDRAVPSSLFGDLMLFWTRHGIHVLRSAHWQRAAAVDNEECRRRARGALAARCQPRSRCALPSVRGFQSSNTRTAGEGPRRACGRGSPSLPEPFTPEQIANANTEFIAFVKQGGAIETARQLAARHSPRAGELFKLGAFWG